MVQPVTTIEIPDLSPRVREELAQELPPDTLRVQEAAPHALGGQSRDIPTATAIVTVSLATLRVLAVLIARHTTRERTEFTVQTRKQDGSLRTIRFRHSAATTQSEAGVLKQLAAACKVEVETPEAEVLHHLTAALTGHGEGKDDGDNGLDKADGE